MVDETFLHFVVLSIFRYATWFDVRQFCLGRNAKLPFLSDRDMIRYFINGSRSQTVYLSSDTVSTYSNKYTN